MFKYIKSLVMLFFVPALREAAAQTTVEIVDRVLYGDTPRRRGYSTHNKSGYANYNRPRTMEDIDKLEKERIARVKARRALHENEPFHDVLMIAFDITAASPAIAYQWLLEQMPSVTEGGDIKLDSYWVADDESVDSDCDSAVFVTKGKQEEARELLRKHGLVD